MISCKICKYILSLFLNKFMNVSHNLNSIVGNDAEKYLINFKKCLFEHMRNNEIIAIKQIREEIRQLRDSINFQVVSGGKYFLDILSEMQQLTNSTIEFLNNNKNNNTNSNNNILAESSDIELHNDIGVYTVNKLQRMIKHQLLNEVILCDMLLKLKDVNSVGEFSIYYDECVNLFGKYDKLIYCKLYEVIVKSDNIYKKDNTNISMSKNNNDDKSTISIDSVKNLINEVINETLSSNHESIDSNDYEPIEGTDDVDGNRLSDLKNTVNHLIGIVKNETGDYDKAYDRLVNIYDKLSADISNPRLSSGDRSRMEHDYEGVMGLIYNIIGGGGGEKMYVKEGSGKPLSDKNRLLIIKWVEKMGCRDAAIRMIDSILKTKLGLGTDDLADTSTFAGGVDAIESALEQSDYAGAYNIAYDTAQEMIDEEGGDGLFEGGKNRFSVYYQEKNPSSVSKSGGWRIAASFGDKVAAEKFAKDPKNKQEYGAMSVDKYDSEYDMDESIYENKCNCGEKCNCKQLSECGSWEEAVGHPDFKHAILKEVAPPGMENWIKANKARFKGQYGDKKGVSALYATAWKMFYNKKK